MPMQQVKGMLQSSTNDAVHLYNLPIWYMIESLIFTFNHEHLPRPSTNSILNRAISQTQNNIPYSSHSSLGPSKQNKLAKLCLSEKKVKCSENIDKFRKSGPSA